jgi:hypothetical protein
MSPSSSTHAIGFDFKEPGSPSGSLRDAPGQVEEAGGRLLSSLEDIILGGQLRSRREETIRGKGTDM